ncbi:MAG: tetratricopeptide repeat protein [Bacteroidota bacterium]|nr:tetratricopeptide repeat protein [Bacteroidota bacterium]
MFILKASGQNSSAIVDSLKTALSKTGQDTLRVKILNELANEEKWDDFQHAFKYATDANDLAVKLKYEPGKMNAQMMMGLAYYYSNKYDSALFYYDKALIIAEGLKKDERIAIVLNNIGLVHHDRADYKNALDHYFRSMKLMEKSDNKKLQASLLNNIALIFQEQKKYDDALSYHEKALKIKREIKNLRGIGSSLHNIGLVYKLKGELDKSLEYNQLALVERKKAEDLSGVAMTLNNIGSVYEDKKEYDRALGYFEDALKIQESLDDKYYLTITLYSLSSNNFYREKYPAALSFAEKALGIAKENGLNALIKHGYELITSIYAKQNKFEKAYEYQLLFIKMKDSILNSENSKQMNELQTQYETEKKQKELELATKNNEIQTLELNKNKLWMWIMVVAILLVITLSVLLYNRYQIKRKANTMLEHRNSEMALQKKEITDSINYAKRIQESILPPQDHWQKLLPESFIFYRPKDIVSGDFYWVEQREDVICFAAVDCTGHGVPGALMSVVGFNLLTQAVNEMKLSIPSEILKHLDHGVTKTLRQSEEGKGVKDGMDLSLCSLNLKTNELQYAGAFNSLYYFSKGVFHEIKADKFPIGVNIDGKVDEYTNHTIQLEKGDTVYLYSDGYADQFGGPKGKKFKYNQLKELLKEIHSLSPENQKQVIEERFDSWKRELEQVDDVVIIGVRV